MVVVIFTIALKFHQKEEEHNSIITIIILITAFISIIAVHLTTLSVIKSSKNLKSVAN